MAFAIIVLFLFLSVAKASLTPGITGSIHVSSLNIVSQIALTYIGPKLLDKHTVLLDHVGADNWIASLDIYDVHLRDNIDWRAMNMDILALRDDVIELRLQDFSTNADFDYVFSTWFSDTHGTGTVVIQGLKVLVLATISGDESNWNIELKQQEVSFDKLHINLSSSILQALVDFVESTIQSKVSNALRDTVLPPLNNQIYEALHSSDPRSMAAQLGQSGYFFNYYPSRRPRVEETNNYLEIFIDGLTYNNKTLETVATHDLPIAFRRIGAQDLQIYFSDNTLTSLLHPLMVQFTNPYSQIKLAQPALVSTIHMIAPNLADYFGNNATYILKTDYSGVSPEFLIENDKLIIKNLKYGASLSGYNATSSEMQIANLTMIIEGIFTLNMTNNLVRGSVEEIKIIPGTLDVESQIDLGRSLSSLENLIDSSLKFLTRSLGFFNREFNLRDLLPAEYKFLAASLLSFELSLGTFANFGLLGVTLKLI